MLKEDLISFLADTDAWIIAELKKASKTKDWARISNLIDVMDSVHNLQHSDEPTNQRQSCQALSR